jgi:hypothetical protein
LRRNLKLVAVTFTAWVEDLLVVMVLLVRKDRLVQLALMEHRVRRVSPARMAQMALRELKVNQAHKVSRALGATRAIRVTPEIRDHKATKDLRGIKDLREIKVCRARLVCRGPRATKVTLVLPERKVRKASRA